MKKIMSKKSFSWSLDISTTNVGMALWDENCELVELKHLALKNNKETPEEIRYLEKADLFKEYIISYKKRVETEYNCKINNVFVEAPLPNTKLNINTTAKLLSFNGIVCYILKEIFNTPPYIITVHISRKIFFPEYIKKVKKKGVLETVLSFPKNSDVKDLVWKKVSKLEPHLDWVYNRNNNLDKINYDMSDAYVVGYSGLRVLGLK